MSQVRAMLGASFLMATSAVGPGFLTQTTVFTQSLMASFAFVILISVLIDIAVQLNVWRIIGLAEMRAQEIADGLLPGLGKLIAFLIVLGGLAFNIGNVGGGGLGLNALLDVSFETGAMISAGFAVSLFLFKEFKRQMDLLTQLLGALMLALIIYVAMISKPPVGEALKQSLWPERFDFLAIVTLVGGTVGGYITFAGGHRLLDAGISGRKNLGRINTSAISGIIIASLVRIFLFLAVLGVLSQGLTLDAANPPASVFKLAAGAVGFKLFGLVMFVAAVTSIIGSAYTSISFLRSYSSHVREHEKISIVSFILISTLVFVTIGKPVNLLVFAGALNGLILPLTLGTLLLAARNHRLTGGQHPSWLMVSGVVAFFLMAGMGVYGLWNYF
jgi:Mn2+/Fe2+ NRAMP family transporter